jgi:hypothetical protein
VYSQASAGQACVQIALQQCNALGGQCTTSPQYLALYRQCLNDEAAKAAAAAKKRQENANVTAGARNMLQPRTGRKAYHSK